MPERELVEQAEQAGQRRPRDHGRTVVRRVVPVQAKMVVGAANDRYEAEADRVATEVTRRLAGPASASANPVATGSDTGTVRREADPASAAGGPVDGATEGRIRTASGGGTSLGGSVRDRMERGFGADFGRVRIHTGGHAADLNRQVGARAFTAGHDIFFGSGEYRPETASGQQLLAHELTHTIQQGGGSHRVTRLRRSTADPVRVSAAPRAVQRWSLFDRKNPQPPDWDSVMRIRTLRSGQPVLFVDDINNDTIVVKAEGTPIGRTQLVAGVLRDVGKAAVVKTRDITNHKPRILAMIDDEGLTNHPSWAALGNARPQAQGTSPEEKGREHMKASFGRPDLDKVQAMQLAEGDSAKSIADPAQFQGEGAKAGSPLLHWYGQDHYLQEMGRITAVDLFLENGDRFYGGNTGNWMTDAQTGAIQLIDNLDDNANAMFSGSFRAMKPSTDIDADGDLIKQIASNKLAATAKETARKLRVSVKYDDPNAEAWMKAEYKPGVTNHQHMEEQILIGLREGRKTLVRRFATSKTNWKGRAVKKAAKRARELDGADAGDIDYWEILKARGRWLQRH